MSATARAPRHLAGGEARREVRQALADGPLTLTQLEFSGNRRPGELFAAINRLRNTGIVEARCLGGGEFEFALADGDRDE